MIFTLWNVGPARTKNKSDLQVYKQVCGYINTERIQSEMY